MLVGGLPSEQEARGGSGAGPWDSENEWPVGA